MYTPEQLHDSIETITRYRREFDRETTEFNPGVYIFTTVHRDGAKARQMCNEKLSTQYAQDFTKLVPRYALAGTPEECRTRLKEYVDAGARTIILTAAGPEEYNDENLSMIAQEVIPAFRSGA